jgi:clan AA aspartic protease
MTQGTVNEYLEAQILITVLGMMGNRTSVEAVIDTGFDGFLTLPLETIAQLALVAHNVMPVMLSDGTTIQAMYFEAEVDWEGQRKPILVQEAPNIPLAGMALLKGMRLIVDIEPGGLVQLEQKQS